MAEPTPVQRFLQSPNAVDCRGFIAVSSTELDPFDETYPEEWLTWLIDPNAQLPYQIFQIETPVPEGRQQAAKAAKYPDGAVVLGRNGRYIRQVKLPRQIKSTEDAWVLVTLQDMDWRIKPTDIADRMYRDPSRNDPEEGQRFINTIASKMRDFRERQHKLAIHPKRTQAHIPARSELEAIDLFDAVNIKYNFTGMDLGNGWFTPFRGGPQYPYPNPTGLISRKMQDIVKALENARGLVHHGGYKHWRELPVYPGTTHSHTKKYVAGRLRGGQARNRNNAMEA